VVLAFGLLPIIVTTTAAFGSVTKRVETFDNVQYGTVYALAIKEPYPRHVQYQRFKHFNTLW
jgi:hypothetical protein